MTGRWTAWRSCCRILVLSVLLWPLVCGDGYADQPHDRATRAGPSRVLLLLAARDDARAAEQARILAADRPGATERDLVLVEPALADQERLRRRYDVAPGEFAVLLIGKDDGVKLRSARPLTVQTLFDAIDAMPMRRAEMRHRAGQRHPLP